MELQKGFCTATLYSQKILYDWSNFPTSVRSHYLDEYREIDRNDQ